MSPKQSQKNTGTFPVYPIESIVMAAATAVSAADNYDSSGSYRIDSSGLQLALTWCV